MSGFPQPRSTRPNPLAVSLGGGSLPTITGALVQTLAAVTLSASGSAAPALSLTGVKATARVGSVAVYNNVPVMDGPIFEVLLQGDTMWTNLLLDVIASNGLYGRRGLAGSTPYDCTATTGTLGWTLNNNFNPVTGGLEGRYSPRHPNVITGWTYGIPCRLQYRANGQLFPIWYGKIRTIRPSAGQHRVKTVDVTAQDAIGDFAEYRLREVATQVDKTESELIQTVVEALPAAAQPVAFALDPGLHVFPFALEDVHVGANALNLLTDILRSAQGRLFATSAGHLRYLNLDTLATTMSSLTLTDATLHAGSSPAFDVPSSLGNVYDRVRLTIHPRRSGTANGILYAATSTIEIQPNETLEFFGDYSDPNDRTRTVGGKDFLPSGTGERALTPYTHYEANLSDAGTSTDVTSSVTVLATPFATTVKFSISHTLASSVYLIASGNFSGPIATPWLRFHGTPIYLDDAPMTVESVSEQSYGDRLIEMDLRYQGDVHVAQDLAHYLRVTYANLDIQAQTIEVNPQAVGMAAVLAREIGDVVTVSETMTALSSATMRIQAIEFRMIPTRQGGYLLFTWQLAPTTTSQVWILDDPVASVLDSTTVLGW